MIGPHDIECVPGRDRGAAGHFSNSSPVRLVQLTHRACGCQPTVIAGVCGNDLVFKQVLDSPHPWASSGKLLSQHGELVILGQQNTHISTRLDREKLLFGIGDLEPCEPGP
jgi:hypothetical protein